jgi:methylmalonyl-CoA mutase
MQVIVGVNKYTHAEAEGEGVAVRQIDNTAVLENQMARLAKLRAARDEQKVGGWPPPPRVVG